MVAMNHNKYKKLINAHESFLVRIYNFIGRNKKKLVGGGNKLIMKGFAKRCRIEVIGKDNAIFIEGNLTRLTGCTIVIHGSNNTINIGSHVVFDRVVICIEDNNNTITIGDNTWMNANVELAAIEGTNIIIGKDCMFSSNIYLRTGDSHSILNAGTRLRINPSQDIELGEHVWVGNGARILKGATIGSHSIVSTGAIVTSKEFPGNSILAGIPAKVVKSGISWDRSRRINFE